MHVEILSADDVEKAVPRLADILIDAVASGAGVSFLHPLAREDAEKFWQSQIPGVRAKTTFILVSKNNRSEISGTVMLHKAWAPNQKHRGDVAKLLVHRDFRRQGAGSALMLSMEDLAIKLGLQMINFDAVAGGASDQLYRTLGYQVVGTVPGYAYSNMGDTLDDVIFFYKKF